MHVMHTHTCRQNTHTHKINKYLKERKKRGRKEREREREGGRKEGKRKEGRKEKEIQGRMLDSLEKCKDPRRSHYLSHPEGQACQVLGRKVRN